MTTTQEKFAAAAEAVAEPVLSKERLKELIEQVKNNNEEAVKNLEKNARLELLRSLPPEYFENDKLFANVTDEDEKQIIADKKMELKMKKMLKDPGIFQGNI